MIHITIRFLILFYHYPTFYLIVTKLLNKRLMNLIGLGIYSSKKFTFNFWDFIPGTLAICATLFRSLVMAFFYTV